VAKKTLYQALQVSETAAAEVVKAAYQAKIAALEGSGAPEVAAERIIVREAYELLADPVRRKLYDEKLREERFRALSSGGGAEQDRPRPANKRPEPLDDSSPRSAKSWIAGIAMLTAVGVIGGWVWLDHKRKVEAHRLQELRQAEELRQQEEKARLARETVDWAKNRIDVDRRSAEEQRQDALRERDRRQSEYDRQRQTQLQAQEDRRRQLDDQRAQAEQRRQDQESLRRSQLQLERDRRYLQELERNRGMAIPAR
jgi:curved DNA-binding protein CbpA